MHLYGFDSIMMFCLRGETLQHTGNVPGMLTRRMLVRELLLCKMAVEGGSQFHPQGFDYFVPLQSIHPVRKVRIGAFEWYR